MSEECSVEARIELARLDERIKAFQREIDHHERANAAALKIASDELARRLDVLNHAHQQAEEARRETVPRETFDARVLGIEEKVRILEGNAREAHGRMWLPMVLLASATAALAAAAAKLLFP